jgi:hypothetical protein
MTVARRPSAGPKPTLPATAPRPPARAARPAQSPGDLIGLQRSAGNRAVARTLPFSSQQPSSSHQPFSVQRFGSEEHRQLGDAGSGGASVDLDIGDPAHPLTHGDMVALSGDYFGSPQEIMTLAGSENGKAQLRWARFESLHRGDPGPVGDDVKQAVKDRYYRLAAVNISHFSAGGTARTQYEQQHRSAMQIAFTAAATGDRQQVTTGQVTEAFSQHFLTDMFSAGHIRTPRADIKAWYDGHLGNSVGRFVDYTAHWVTERLDAFGDIPFWCPNSQIQDGVRSKVRELGGSAVDSFSLGDIVSLAMHDRDNREGVWVLSDLDQSGAPVSGGYVWPEKAMGDNHLAESAVTRLMAEQAVQASLRETQAAAAAGHALTAGACVPPERLEVALNQFMAKAGPPRALGFVPRADPQRTQAYVTAGAQAAAGELNYR